ncbi:UNVERIFIED_CONTAM: Cytokinin dehydrogenase 3 [Sesamum latifolium]|uniref:cytokinin dehydrogenase n=1 Tax=Sesamum latifolium TaxID=2727402 RepID=A0AAW2U116_9LAMI
MPNPCLISSHFVLLTILLSCITSMCSLGKFTSPLPNDIISLDLATRLRNDPHSINIVSNDYGNLVHESPSAVLYPSSIDDIVNLIKFSNNCSTPFGISARGRGHSVRGQAMARGGVVVDMPSLSQNGIGIRVSWDPSLGYYADVGGEQMWIDVLRAGLEYGLAPVSWTDYLYLSVGGTLSNAGISGQSFLHGPQISNVLELDVITGKGELFTCSQHMNSELFFAVLGGLGQFGIITRARIVLEKAASRAKWVRMLYSDFSIFTRDQEHLISSTVPDYVEGSLITHQSPPNNWRSSFYTPPIAPRSLLYSNPRKASSTPLNSSNTTTIRQPTISIRWDDRMSAVTPDEDVFYTLGLLQSSGAEESGEYDKLNNEIIEFCEKSGIKIKQYLPHYKSEEDWMEHYGPKWNTFLERKNKFDPRMILSPGQRIFTSAIAYSDV